MFDFNMFKKNVEDLTGKIRDIKEKIENHRQQLDLLVAAPPTKANMIAILHDRIDSMAKNYPNRLAKNLQPWMGINANGLYDQQIGFLVSGSQNFGGNLGNANALVEGMAFLLRDQFKQGISSAIEAASWPDGAIALEDRDSEIKRVEKLIQDLEKEDEKLRNMAASAGIVLNF